MIRIVNERHGDVAIGESRRISEAFAQHDIDSVKCKTAEREPSE